LTELSIGLDIGTQGVKALLFDAGASAVVARASRPLSLVPGLPPGAAEQHPEEWWRAAVAAVRELLLAPGVDPGRVRAIGVSGQQHGAVFVDAEGNPLRAAKLWCDTSTAAEARELSRRLGRAVPVGFTASKVAWFAATHPAEWARTTTVLLPHDFIVLRLSGKRVTEAGDASGTGWFDPRARGWDPAALAAVAPGLATRLPELLAAGEAAGPVAPDAALALGLPRDVVIAAGGGDNMMSAIGAGATRPGVLVISLGTSGTVFARTDRPIVDPEGLIASFCSSDGGWLPLFCTMNCTNVLEEVRAAFRPDLPAENAYEHLTAGAERVPIGAGGVMFLPFLLGERVPDLPGATGALEGLRPGSLREEVVFRAALEGVACQLSLGVERLERLGVAVREVRLVGGGSRNRLWRSLLADLIGAPVSLPVEPESAAFGAALQAHWTLRRAEEPELGCDEVASAHVRLAPTRIEPDPGRRAALAAVRERFRARIGALPCPQE